MSHINTSVNRRRLLVGLGLGATAVATGCTSANSQRARIVGGNPSVLAYQSPRNVNANVDPKYQAMYGEMYDGGERIPAVDLSRVNPRYYRQEVADPTGEEPGTVVIDTGSKFAYVVEPGGRAMRYGVGVGREGMEWSGRARIDHKRRWPTWTPPAEMIDRQPSLQKFADGQPGGIRNPLGARALYLYQDGKDTLYRLHGSPEYWTIGTAGSSGCIRFMNQDIIDLYNRVPSGSKVLVKNANYMV